MIWQPPEERGHSEESARLMAYFVQRGVRSILFSQARQSVERMVRLVREQLPPAADRQSRPIAPAICTSSAGSYSGSHGRRAAGSGGDERPGAGH